MQTYSEKAIALVLDLHQKKHVAQGIESFVDFFRFLEQDDTAYLFNVKKELYNKRSRAVACLSQYKFKRLKLPFLIRNALDVLAPQPEFFHKVLYVVSDSLPDAANMTRVKNVIAKNGIKTLCFEVGNTKYVDYFDNHTRVEDVKQAKAIVEADYRKDVVIED